MSRSGHMNKKQMEKEIQALKEQVKVFQKEPSELPAIDVSDLGTAIKTFIEEREKTNKRIELMMEKLKELDEAVKTMGAVEQSAEEYSPVSNREIGLSSVDAKIINYVQTSPDGMACADAVRKYMGYNGNNAACARLNRLYKLGLLERHQLGHKVYYKFDAGKATNTLIVSPPQ
jgi:hypothetical protein